MKYVQLGNTGLRVSPICVGCMSYSDTDPASRFNWALGEENALPVIQAAYDAGLNFFHTADVYGNGRSEEILGKAMKQFAMRRESLVIATKCFYTVGRTSDDIAARSEHERDNSNYINQYGLSRKHIFHAVDASLKRLGTDYIDLYQVHRFDPNTPVAETMEALHDVVKSGKVRYIGASSMYAHQLLEMQYTTRMRGWTEFVSIQNLYNPIYREEEKEMYPACANFSMAGIPWSPLAQGYCARPLSDMQSTDRGRKMLRDGLLRSPFTEQDEAINKKIAEVAKARKVSMAIVTLAWCLSKPFIHAPIVGMSSVDRVKEAIEALDFELSKEEIESIDGLYKNAKNVIAI